MILNLYHPNPMKPHLALLTVLSAGSLILAQSMVPPAGGNPPPGAAEQTVQLNPFVISVDNDDGYAPTETLSGTRLKSPVKDVPSALSIISSDMLADLGALGVKAETAKDTDFAGQRPALLPSPDG